MSNPDQRITEDVEKFCFAVSDLWVLLLAGWLAFCPPACLVFEIACRASLFASLLVCLPPLLPLAT